MKERYKFKKRVMVNCLLRIVVGMLALFLEMRALKHPGFYIFTDNKTLFLLSFLYYINYVIFAIGEVADSIINRNDHFLENYKRSKLKSWLFRIGKKLEIFSIAVSILIYGYLFLTGEVLIAISFIILYLIELINRYHTLAGFFDYIFVFEIYTVLCSLLLGRI